jgi:uncharacterized protein (DUF2236 family)
LSQAGEPGRQWSNKVSTPAQPTQEALATPEAAALAAAWPAPLTARELDRLVPGVLDGIHALGAGAANVIMQLAYPQVGYGVLESRVDSGKIFKHPIKRTRTTFTYLAVAILGTAEEKLAYRKAVNGAHAQVYSTADSPVKYHAFDPMLQLWVAACLYWGFADTIEKFRGKLTPDKAAELYKRAEALGTTLQVRPGMWPPDLGAFRAYWDDGLRQVHIDDTIRAYLTDLAELKFLHPVIHLPLGRFNRFVTAGFLPRQFREAMHFDWGPVQQRRFDRLIGVLAVINRTMPRPVRQAPFLAVMWDFRRRLHKGLPLV